MKRVRARSLALVNWKGVFYERYSLDDYVTALEGVNGAGKTTVMIAAYVVLLPDLTRLRFTNVGESDATGGDRGIWGRLGNPNRPSYSVIKFDLGNEQILAGVHLERKGEPSVELTPFVIRNLPDDVRLQDVLLLKSNGNELVPELSDLRENVASLGGQMSICRTAKEYFDALFEKGITPLRLATDEERGRLSEMLRTSMTGGISRALTSGFRSFLLKEESGLAETLVRMRENLNACRRTRLEVKEAQELEGEISGVYEAGYEMFASALLATRERSEEMRRRVEDAKDRRDKAQIERDKVSREQEEKTEELKSITEKLTHMKEEHERAQHLFNEISAANKIVKQIDERDLELERLLPALGAAEVSLKQADDLRSRRNIERTRAEDTYRAAADGLADFQRGLEELHRRADAYRMVSRRLAEAKETLKQPAIDFTEIDEQEERVQTLLNDLDQKRNQLDASISSAEIHRQDYQQAMDALLAIIQKDVAANEVHDAAKGALRHLSELEFSAERVTPLEQDVARLRLSNKRQQAAQAKAKEWSLDGDIMTSSSDVSRALSKSEGDARMFEQLARDEEAKATECQRMCQRLHSQQKELQAQSIRWKEMDAIANQLENDLDRSLRSEADLDSARTDLDNDHDGYQRQLEINQESKARIKEQIWNLEKTGGTFHRDTLSACDAVGGELLAGRFDDVDPDLAGHIQAKLGPLTDAIVVGNARNAAQMLIGNDRELETLWLIEESSIQGLVPSPIEDGIDLELPDVVVEQNGIVRTTRVSPKPTLGRKARLRLIAELRLQSEELGNKSSEIESRLEEIASCRHNLGTLMRNHITLQFGDPTSKLTEVEEKLKDLRQEIVARSSAADEAQRRASQLTKRINELRDLLVEAFLLDEPSFRDLLNEKEAELQSAVRARKELSRVSLARKNLGERIDALKRVPLSSADLSILEGELRELGSQREQLFLAKDALRYVADHREALAWSDAEDSLSAKQELVPSLKSQCDTADAKRTEAVGNAKAAEEAWELRRTEWRDLDDKRNAIAASRERLKQELDQFKIDDPSDNAVELAREEVRNFKLLCENLDRDERQAGNYISQLKERLEGREASLAEAQEHLNKEEKEWKPAEQHWERLRTSAQTNGLLTTAIATRLMNVGAGSVNLRTEARGWAGRLMDRITSAKGGGEIHERILGWISGQEQITGDDYLQAWEVVRDWLRRRVPTQIAETNDPLESLQRLRSHLKTLAGRLEAQESALRGVSEDVARGIEVHIRTAHRQVRLLNQELEGVRFGTIRGMRIRLARDDRMEGVLNALKEGSAQELLFAPNRPIEEVFEELFTRYGGRGSTVGQRLLDYREYVDIAVEIQRQSSNDWERVNPSKLSTGESIGVGTALMMVVLTAWERAANLFRSKRSLGTLRFLFLDEANRLSQDNLGVLFEMCSSLDLQLLIAAPEVAAAQGCTTYRLVRSTTSTGEEEVLVSGRRMRAEA